MFSRPRWYIVFASLAVAVLGMLASIAIPLSASDDTDQQILDRLDKLSERMDRLEGRLGERPGYHDMDQNDMGSLHESLEELRKSLESDSSDGGRRLRFMVPSDDNMEFSCPGMAFTFGSDDYTELKEILQGLAKERGRVEFNLKDGEWKIDMKGKLDSDTKKRIDEAVDKLTADNDKLEVECIVEENGSCSLSVSTGDGDGPNIETRIYSDTGDGVGDMWERCVPKPMPKELREKLRDLDKERQEKIKDLLKEYGYEEDDFPMLGFGLGSDGADSSIPFMYRFRGGDDDGPGFFFGGPGYRCPWTDLDSESDD